MTAILGYTIAGILSIILGIVAMIKYKMFAVQEPLEVLPEPQFAPESVPLPEVKEIPMPTKTDELYALSKSLLGQRLGRDKSIPWMVNCANACTDVLYRAGVKGLGTKGIAGTASLLHFFETSGQFKEVYSSVPGAIIISATGTGNGKARGHVGISGNNQIMSNNSESGRWDTVWEEDRWVAYYTKYGGMSTRHFVLA